MGNDTWSIHFSENEPQLSVKIFDHGKLITTLNKIKLGTGTYNGQLLPATDYWFVVTRENGKEYKGHFSLKR
jgi:gliding motility-associated-like protein